MDNYNNGRFEGPNEDGRDVYMTVVEDRRKTRAWSIASLVLGILSITCCCFGWLGLAMGALAILFTVISRKTLGYFDGLSIGGLITAIFGVIFSGVVIYVEFVLMNSPEYAEQYEQYIEELNKMLEETKGGSNSVFSAVKRLIK